MDDPKLQMARRIAAARSQGYELPPRQSAMAFFKSSLTSSPPRSLA